MEGNLDAEEYDAWFSHLLPPGGYAPLLLVSASATLGVFGVGYVIAAIGGVASTYLFSPAVYLSAGGIFWTLAWLGWADQVYVDVWNEVRSAFAVDDETYRDVVHPRLDRIYDERSLLGYWSLVAVPSLGIISVLYLPGVPPQLQHPVQLFVLGDTGFWPTLAVLNYLYVTVETLLLVTAFYAFVNHLALLEDVSELPFRDLYTAASELEPVVGFSMASATAWFGGVSVVLVWTRTQHLDAAVQLVPVAVLVLVGVVIFLAPMVILHVALVDSKRSRLVEVRREYDETHRLMEQGRQPDEAYSLRLEMTDRRLQNAKSIRTWPYNIVSTGKLVTASFIPWLTLVEKVSALLLNG